MLRKVVPVFFAVLLITSMAGAAGASTQTVEQTNVNTQGDLEDADELRSLLEETLDDDHVVFELLEFDDESEPEPAPDEDEPADEPADDSDESEPEPEPEPDPEPEPPAEDDPDNSSDDSEGDEADDPAPEPEPDESVDEPADDGDEGLDRAEVERHVHDLVNQERQERGLEPLEHDDELREIARGHSEDMAERDYFSHESPEGDRVGDRYEQAGYDDWTTAGENIAYRTVDDSEREIAEGLVDQWVGSDGHRAAILSESYDRQGIGVEISGDRAYATENFAG